MKREYRVRKHREFDRIIHGGKRVKSPNFTIYYQASDLPHGRIGIAVSKSNGHAVKRVRIKRQVRAMLAKRGDYETPLDLIIVLRPSFDEAAFAENEKELNASLDHIKETTL